MTRQHNALRRRCEPPFRYAQVLRRFAAIVVLGASVVVACPPAMRLAAADETAPLPHDPLVVTLENGRGRINYGAGIVKATGYGIAPASLLATDPARAQQAALDDAHTAAIRTLARAVGDIQVTAASQISTISATKDGVATGIASLVQSAPSVSASAQPDGTAIVVVELPLYGQGSVGALILPALLPKPAPAKPVAPEVEGSPAEAPAGAPAGTPASASAAPPTAASSEPAAAQGGADAASASGATAAPPPASASDSTPELDMPSMPTEPPSLGGPAGASTDAAAPTPATDAGPFTALVLDCRGLGTLPALCPRIVDAGGREIYGPTHATLEFAVETGIVGYPRSAAEALSSSRSGAHPLVVRAVRPSDVHSVEATVSVADADRILTADARDHYLAATRVLVLIGPAP